MVWSHPPAKLDFSRFNWIDFAFAVPTKSAGVSWEDPAYDPKTLTALVSAAHQAGTKVKLSVGGWTGSKFVALPGFGFI
jgi:chitinase